MATRSSSAGGHAPAHPASDPRHRRGRSARRYAAQTLSCSPSRGPSVDDVLGRVDAGGGALSGVTVVDPTNPLTHGVGRHLLETGSAAQHIAAQTPGAHVVKAFNVHPAAVWENVRSDDVVTLAGDHVASLNVVQELVCGVGAIPHILGGLDRARQIEELAGTVIALAFCGIDPRSAVPHA